MSAVGLVLLIFSMHLTILCTMGETLNSENTTEFKNFHTSYAKVANYSSFSFNQCSLSLFHVDIVCTDVKNAHLYVIG